MEKAKKSRDKEQGCVKIVISAANMTHTPHPKKREKKKKEIVKIMKSNFPDTSADSGDWSASKV